MTIGLKVRKKVLRRRDRIARKRAKKWVAAGEYHLARGDIAQAYACCRSSLSMHPDIVDAYLLLGKVLMPGEDYLDVLSHFHESMKPESYVEIGVASGDSLALAGKDTSAVGVDPRPCIDKKIQPQTKLYPITSDEFFQIFDLLNELGSSRLALAFIDGLHDFEQVLKDFINLERVADKKTVFLIHDCLPVARLVASRTPATSFWCGDVWKIIPCLKTHRPDLDVHVIPARPSGLGMITRLNPKSTVLRDRYDQIAAEYRDRDPDYEYLDLAENSLDKKVSNLIPNDWRKIAALLSLPE
jgi:tetratricopeptide (TPR) repeat protein